MSVQTIKQTLHQLIDKINDEDLLQAYLKIIESNFEKGGRVTIEQYNKEIEEAEGAVDSGEFINHEEAVKQIKGWKSGLAGASKLTAGATPKVSADSKF